MEELDFILLFDALNFESCFDTIYFFFEVFCFTLKTLLLYSGDFRIG